MGEALLEVEDAGLCSQGAHQVDLKNSNKKL